LLIFEIGPGNMQGVIHLHNVDHGAAGFFFHLTKLAVQFTHLQTKATFDDCLQAAVALSVIGIKHSHHFVLVGQNQTLSMGHFHLSTPVAHCTVKKRHGNGELLCLLLFVVSMINHKSSRNVLSSCLKARLSVSASAW